MKGQGINPLGTTNTTKLHGYSSQIFQDRTKALENG